MMDRWRQGARGVCPEQNRRHGQSPAVLPDDEPGCLVSRGQLRTVVSPGHLHAHFAQKLGSASIDACDAAHESCLLSEVGKAASWNIRAAVIILLPVKK